MVDYSVFVLEESNVSISGGESLDGINQGTGEHLLGETITLLNDDLIETFVSDGDANFDDNDGNQRLAGDQTIDGVTYSDGTRVEAEYQLELTDPDGNVYIVIGYNIRNSSPAFGTVEGLAFVGDLPPVGVPLTVTGFSEGPGSSGQADLPSIDLFVPCYTPGTLIYTQTGLCAVEDLQVGDKVQTLDNGLQPIRWVGHVHVSSQRLAADPSLCPIRVKANAMGPGKPMQDMMLSPQHRVFLKDWRAELLFGATEWLVAITHLVNDQSIIRASDVRDVTYIHFMFDRHEVVCADGIWAESYLPGPMTLPALSPETQAELFTLFPELETEGAPQMTPARPVMKRWETKLLA